MKRLVVGILGSLMLLILGARPAAAQERTFRGEITDEHLNCIQTPMKAPPELKEKNACVLYWAHFTTPPSKYVLYDAATKTTYQLDDQDTVQPYVAGKVKITGTYDEATKTIHVKSIVPDYNKDQG